MRLLLPDSVRKQMERHAADAYPEECCGFFFGVDSTDRRITQIRRVSNASKDNRKRRFVIAPPDYRKAEDHAQKQGLDLLGVYHSHPDHPAEPSVYDHKSALPWFSYIIISVADVQVRDLRSWRLGKNLKFVEDTVMPDSNESLVTNKSI